MSKSFLIFEKDGENIGNSYLVNSKKMQFLNDGYGREFLKKSYKTSKWFILEIETDSLLNCKTELPKD